MKRATTIGVILSIAVLSITPASGFEARRYGGGPSGIDARTGSMPVVLERAEFTLARSEDGLRIDMDGFGWLASPGKPLLPSRTSLFLLPPQARVSSVEVTDAPSILLPGRYDLAHAPPLLPATGPKGSVRSLARERSNWEGEHEAAYSTDDAYRKQTEGINKQGHEWEKTKQRLVVFSQRLGDKLIPILDRRPISR